MRRDFLRSQRLRIFNSFCLFYLEATFDSSPTFFVLALPSVPKNSVARCFHLSVLPTIPLVNIKFSKPPFLVIYPRNVKCLFLILCTAFLFRFSLGCFHWSHVDKWYSQNESAELHLCRFESFFLCKEMGQNPLPYITYTTKQFSTLSLYRTEHNRHELFSIHNSIWQELKCNIMLIWVDLNLVWDRIRRAFIALEIVLMIANTHQVIQHKDSYKVIVS